LKTEAEAEPVSSNWEDIVEEIEPKEVASKNVATAKPQDPPAEKKEEPKAE